MKLNDLRLQRGRPGQPVVVLIHGFGMNGGFWRQPDSCFVLGGLATLSVFLADQPPDDRKKVLAFGRTRERMRGLGPQLVEDGFSVVSWSQQAPVGSIHLAVDELREVMAIVRDTLPERPVWLLGHSRGGLVARLYLGQRRREEIVGCITLGAPHGGTELASLAGYLQPAGAALRKFLSPLNSKGKLMSVLQRMAGFLGSEAIGELKPDSPLLQSLTKPPAGQMPLFSFGGTEPGLFSLYRRGSKDWKRLSFPDFLLRVIPDRKIPPELIVGMGDGLVTARSSRLPGALHEDYAVNHVRLAFEPEIGRKIRKIIGW